jgi:hypothetical protein
MAPKMGAAEITPQLQLIELNTLMCYRWKARECEYPRRVDQDCEELDEAIFRSNGRLIYSCYYTSCLEAEGGHLAVPLILQTTFT